MISSLLLKRAVRSSNKIFLTGNYTKPQIGVNYYRQLSTSLNTQPNETDEYYLDERSKIEQEIRNQDPLYELKQEIRNEQQALGEIRNSILKERLEEGGRYFSDDMEITDEDLLHNVGLTYDDLPDWSFGVVSQKSKDHVKVLESIPTILELSSMDTLEEALPHPAYDAETYHKSLEMLEYERIYKLVQEFSEEQIQLILDLEHDYEKQDAIDDLFISIEKQVMEQEGMRLGHVGIFSKVIEQALEQYLEEVNQKELLKFQKSNESDTDDTRKAAENETIENIPTNNKRGVFINLKPTFEKLAAPHGGYFGKIIEDFELAAARDTNHLVLVRNTTKQLAQAILENKKHVLLNGRKGVGKSSILNSLIASLRSSNNEYIVLVLPHGEAITKHFKYLVPNKQNDKLYDLPVLSQQACKQILDAHAEQCRELVISKKELAYFFTEEVFKSFQTDYPLFSLEKEEKEVTIFDLLNIASQTFEEGEYTKNLPSKYASELYQTVVDFLSQKQNKFKFIIIADEYNMYHWHSYYYHWTYDDSDKMMTPIPFTQMTFLKPFLNFPTSSTNDSDFSQLQIIASMSYCKPVSMERNKKMIENFQKKENLKIIDTPRYSYDEHVAMVACYEYVGLGKLRFDRGNILGDEQEMKYLNMVSCGVGKELLESCIM